MVLAWLCFVSVSEKPSRSKARLSLAWPPFLRHVLSTTCLGCMMLLFTHIPNVFICVPFTPRLIRPLAHLECQFAGRKTWSFYYTWLFLALAHWHMVSGKVLQYLPGHDIMEPHGTWKSRIGRSCSVLPTWTYQLDAWSPLDPNGMQPPTPQVSKQIQQDKIDNLLLGWSGMQGWHDSAATGWYNCNQLVVEGYPINNGD